MLQNLSKSEKERLVNIILQRKKISELSLQKRIPEWNLIWQYYCCYKQKQPFKSNVFVPLFFEFVETVSPMIFKSLTAVRPYITIIPMEEDDVSPAANMEKILDLQLSSRESNFKKVLFCAIKDALIFSTSFIKIIPKKENGNLYFVFENVDVYNLLVPPRTTSVQDAHFVIGKYVKTLQHLLENYELSKEDIDEIKNSSSSTPQFDRWSFYTDTERDPSIIEAKVDEYIGMLPLREGDVKEEPVIATLVNDKVLIRLEPNPFGNNIKPYVHLVDTPVSNQFYGIGLLKPIVGLQEEINTRRNQRVDAITRRINVMWKVVKGAGIDITQLISRPDGVIYVPHPDAVQPHIIPDTTLDFPSEIALIRQDAVQASGVFPYLQGQPPSRQETAAGIITLQQAGGLRFSVKVDLFNDMGLSEIGALCSEFNIKFLDKFSVREIVGEKNYRFFKFKNSDIVFKGKVDYYATGSAEDGIQNPQIRRLNYLKLFNILLALPPEITNLLPDGKEEKYYLNQYYLIRRLLEVFDERYANKILTPIIQPQIDENQIAVLKQAIEEAQAVQEAEAEPTTEELLQSIAPPATGVVPKKELRPEETTPDNLARSISARIVR